MNRAESKVYGPVVIVIGDYHLRVTLRPEPDQDTWRIEVSDTNRPRFETSRDFQLTGVDVNALVRMAANKISDRFGGILPETLTAMEQEFGRSEA